MYVPASFSEADRDVLLDFIEAHGFATLISPAAAAPIVSHIPLLVDRAHGRLLGHVARANPHRDALDGRTPALAIFHGPHAYVSPAWYATSPSVPTWNYAVVHVHGIPRLLDSEATAEILRRLIDKYERPRANPWPGDLPAEFVATELRAIMGFEIPIARLEGKFKLGQNRDPVDRQGLLAGLEGEPDSASRELATFSRAYFARGGGG